MKWFAIFLGWLSSLAAPVPTPTVDQPIATPTTQVLSTSQEPYEIHYFHVLPDQPIELIPNFQNQTPVRQLMEINSCKMGINGGFYSEDHKPIGWFMSKGKTLGSQQHNNLFNGFLSRTDDGQFVLDYGLDEKNVVDGIQTGPVVFFESKPTKLNLTRDKQARRMVAGVTRSGGAVFISLNKKDAVLDGPTLAELPGLILDFEQTHTFDIVSAVNLDGGSASGFVSSNFNLDEWSAVGSWWCVK